MSRKLKEPVFDDDNPEWTKADFAKATPPAEILPPELLAQFKNTRGPQKTPTKVAVSIRLSPEVISHFKAQGAGWQSRIDDALRKIVKKAS